MRNSLVRCMGRNLLVLCVCGLTGCEKLKELASKPGEPAAATADHQEGPIVKGTYSRNQISDLNLNSYENFIARKNALVVVDYYSTSCPPCKAIAPVLEKATQLHPGIVYLGKVDVNQAPELGMKMGVQSIPDIRLFKDGKEVDRFVGFPGEDQVLALIAKHSRGIQAPAPAATAASISEAMKPASGEWLPPGMSRK